MRFHFFKIFSLFDCDIMLFLDSGEEITAFSFKASYNYRLFSHIVFSLPRYRGNSRHLTHMCIYIVQNRLIYCFRKNYILSLESYFFHVRFISTHQFLSKDASFYILAFREKVYVYLTSEIKH